MAPSEEEYRFRLGLQTGTVQYPQHTDRQNGMLAVICGAPFLALAFVSLRVYARYRSRLSLSPDDYLIIIANFLSIALIAPSYINVRMWHFGFHVWEVPSKDLEPSMSAYHKILLAYNMIHTPILPLVKASIICLLLRIGSVLVPIRRALYVIFVFNALSCIIPWVIFIFMCPPIPGGRMGPTVFGGLKCINHHQQGILFVYLVTANLFTDLLIFPIPFLMIYKLQQTKRRLKLIAIGSFTLSLAATALGVYRLKESYEFQLFRKEHSSDWTYKIDYCLAHAENNAAIIIACAPTLRALVISWITGDKSQATLQKGSRFGYSSGSGFSGWSRSSNPKNWLSSIISRTSSNSTGNISSVDYKASYYSPMSATAAPSRPGGFSAALLRSTTSSSAMRSGSEERINTKSLNVGEIYVRHDVDVEKSSI